MAKSENGDFYWADGLRKWKALVVAAKTTCTLHGTQRRKALHSSSPKTELWCQYQLRSRLSDSNVIASSLTSLRLGRHLVISCHKSVRYQSLVSSARPLTDQPFRLAVAPHIHRRRKPEVDLDTASRPVPKPENASQTGARQQPAGSKRRPESGST